MNTVFRLCCKWSLLLLLSSGFILACSGSKDECQSTGDCKKSKGSNYICSIKPEGKKCVVKTVSGGCTPKCTGTQKCVGGQCVSCKDDTDCAATENCISGSCTKKTTGGCSPLCATGEKCVGNKCVQCAADTDCKTGEKCTANKCVPPVGGCNPPCTGTDKCFQNQCVQCASDTDCKTGETCTSNKCVAKPACNPACKVGERCVNSKCVQCTKNEECKATEVCNATTGKCDPKPVGGCTPACPSNQKCVNNQCVPKGCTQNSDCAADETCDTATSQCKKKPTGCNPACRSGEKCVNNQCVQCTSNGDCAASEKCSAGKCVPNTIQCNPACQSGEKCVAGKCVQCSSNSDCPSGQNCTNGRCTKKTACTSNANCTAGLICVNNTCVSPAGSACTTTRRCPSGYQCLGIPGNKSVCFQDCGTVPTACAGNTVDGRTSCLTVGTNSTTNQPIRVCLKLNKKNDSCGAPTWTTTGQAFCDSSGTPPLYCNKANKCTEYLYRKKVGETCNKANDTKEPRYLCDPKLSLVCLEKTGKCVKAATAKEGQACDAQGTTLGTPTVCDSSVKGLICVTFPGSIARCQLRCDPTKAGQCSHNSNLTCWKIFTDGGGMCFDLTCTKDSECAFSNYKCQKNPLQGATGLVCWPQPATGPKAYAEACSNPVSTKGCKAGTTCFLTNGENGFCSNDCTSTTCGSAKDATGKTLTAKCESYGTGTRAFKRCVFPCGGTGQTCPKELPHCQNTTNSSNTCSKICTATPLAGPKDFGAICKTPASTDGCKKGMFCLQSSGAAKGYCSRDCTNDNKCPTFKDSTGKSFTPTCTGNLVACNAKICIVSCNQPGQTCPAGTTCQTLGTTKYCLAP